MAFLPLFKLFQRASRFVSISERPFLSVLPLLLFSFIVEVKFIYSEGHKFLCVLCSIFP